jgi:predicted phosphodiesterase
LPFISDTRAIAAPACDGRRSPVRAALPLAIAPVVLFVALAAQQTTVPNKAGSVKFVAMGDNGTGDQPQYDIGRQMAAARSRLPFDLVIMLGDNMYGGQSPDDFVKKFERPYAPLLAAGVKFQASLGNHDRPENVFYKHYNMNGQRYYTFARDNVRFFALDSTQMDQKQVEWLDGALGDAREDWKICYFHHPLYSNAARHGSSFDLRVLLEPIFVRRGVNVVFSGHDHVYERVKPQKGIYYFVSGSAGQLRKGNMRPSPDETAAYFDQDQSFMLVEIAGDEMYFEAISRTGKTIDSGMLRRQSKSSQNRAPAGPPAANVHALADDGLEVQHAR